MAPLVICFHVCLVIVSIAAFSAEREVNEVKSIRKRETSYNYNVNLLLYIDYEIYTRFYKRTNGSSESERAAKTEAEINKYYMLYAQSMNSIYAGIDSSRLKIQISLVDIIISKERETWILLTPDNHLATGTILNNFYSQLTNLQYGHAMLITGHEIIGSQNEKFAGRAVFNSICQEKKQSVSVVVDKGGFQSVRTACHELAHSLGVEHDNGQPGCLENDQYIMAASTMKVDSNNQFNPWIFSTCSVKNMEDFRTSLNTKEQKCLTEKQPSKVNQSLVEKLQPGQEYAPDQQCQMIWGSTAFYRRNNIGDICTSMTCRVGNYHMENRAAEGTSCGNKKWCQLGRCVSSDAAPDKQENCVFGDRPPQSKLTVVIRRDDGQGRFIEDRREMTCNEIVQTFSHHCYTADIASECCSSCSTIQTNVMGCKYGDKIQNCLTSSCDEIYPGGFVPAAFCCGTCNLRAPFVCSDQDNKCNLDASQCYDAKFAFRCCKMCEMARNVSRTDCEYGDRDRDCDVLTKGGTANCDIYKQQCCETCKHHVTSAGYRPILTLSVKLLMLVVIYISCCDQSS